MTVPTLSPLPPARPTPASRPTLSSRPPQLRLVPCGDAEPPLDPPGTDGALALAHALATRPHPPALRLVPPSAPGRAPATAVGDDEVARFARGLVLAVLEVVAGQRPLPQLARVAAPDVFADLQRWSRRPRSSARPSVRSVHVGRPVDDAAEVCAVVHTGTRVAAVALRLQATRSGWRCTALELG